MRTDVKIGVAAALLLVFAFVAWQMLGGSGNNKNDANSADNPLVMNDGAGQTNGSPAPVAGSPLPTFSNPGTSTQTPSPSPEPTRPEPIIPSITPTPEPTTPEPIIPSITPTPEPTTPEPIIPSITPTPEPTTPEPITPTPGPATPSPVIPSITPTPEPVAPTPIIPSITPITPAPPSTGGVTVERTYTVQKGDSGFWAIAEKAYGNGKYYYLIAQANPGVSSSSLRIGSKLVIPPLPNPGRDQGTVTEGSGTAPGGVEITPTGQRIYVVQKGDNGFWGIAAKKYGNGKYYYLIAKANPNVSSSNLKVGDRLVLPEMPAATTTTSGTTGTTVTAGAGQSLYTVTKEDTAGLWGIAKKKYGNGAYYKVIADANPNVKASSLKVGQKLIIPELTDAMKKAVGAATTAPRSSTPATPAPKRSGVEDIGPTPKFN